MSTKQEIEITVPAEDVLKETETVVAGVQKRAHLPGFRPGKAPASLIRTRFKEAIRQDVLESIVPKAFRKKADEENWKVVGSPNVTEVHFHEGEPLRFKAEFEVAPEFEVREYRGVEVEYSEPQVTEEDIDKRVAQIREQKAEYINEDPRPLGDGDHAVVALRSIAGIEGEPMQSDELVLHIGDEETLPDFSENLRGVSPGDEREFEVRYPEDYGQDRLAGKTVLFHVTVKGVRRKEMPELNDEFAQDLGDYQNLGELREAIRKSIYSEREQSAQQEAKGALLDKLVDAHEFPVPEAFVDRQVENEIERRLRQVSASGIDPRTLNLDWHKIRGNYAERATRDVKASLIVEKIADAESIYATNEEVDRELQRIARQQREPVAALRAKYEKDGTLGRIAHHIRTEKALNFLFEHARKVPKATPAETAEPSSTPA